MGDVKMDFSPGMTTSCQPDGWLSAAERILLPFKATFHTQQHPSVRFTLESSFRGLEMLHFCLWRGTAKGSWSDPFWIQISVQVAEAGACFGVRLGAVCLQNHPRVFPIQSIFCRPIRSDTTSSLPGPAQACLLSKWHYPIGDLVTDVM